MRDLDDAAEEMIPPPNTYAPFHRMNTQVEQGLKSMVKEEDSHLTEGAARLNGTSRSDASLIFRKSRHGFGTDKGIVS